MIERHVLGQESYAPSRSRMPERLAQHAAVTRRRSHESHCKVDRSGFSGAVRPEEAKDLATLDRQREVFQRVNGTPAP
jgi:hypothetical protein